MKDRKIEQIKTVGLILAIFGGFMIFGNSAGALGYLLISSMDEGALKGLESEELNGVAYLWRYYVHYCLFLALNGVAILVGGLNLRKLKLWPVNLLFVSAVLLILLIWIVAAAISSFPFAEVAGADIVILFQIIPFFTAIIFTTPLAILLRFLHRKTTKEKLS